MPKKCDSLPPANRCGYSLTSRLCSTELNPILLPLCDAYSTSHSLPSFQGSRLSSELVRFDKDIHVPITDSYSTHPCVRHALTWYINLSDLPTSWYHFHGQSFSVHGRLFIYSSSVCGVSAVASRTRRASFASHLHALVQSQRLTPPFMWSATSSAFMSAINP